MSNALPAGRLPGWLEQAWLQRYLDRELTTEENEWFETYAIDKPSLIAAIDDDNALRDGLNLWHAQQVAQSALGQGPAGASVAADSIHESGNACRLPGMDVARHRRGRLFRPMVAAASLAVAAFLGAGAAQWIGTGAGSKDGHNQVMIPRRVVFDALRGSDATAPMVEATAPESAPLLIDIAVPPQAEHVVAHFADGSALNLPVSNDGFVSLLGEPTTLLRLSPIRISYQTDGHQVDRPLDLSNVL